MKRLHVKNFGPVREADIRFGDLTVLVGPQATGKSLFVQLFKAVKDAGAIRADLKTYGFDWLHGKAPISDYCGLYFGGGLTSVVTSKTLLHRDGKRVDFASIAKPGGNASQVESVFLVPAQRVLVLQDGWPKPFMAYTTGDPYCMRRFSDSVRQLMESPGLQGGSLLFPQPRRLKAELKTLVDTAIYQGSKLELEVDGMRKRIVLSPAGTTGALPYSTWSAGQREFTPLLFGLYWLMPSAKISRRGALDTVVVEEPEMGLHPQAIVTFGLLVLELLQRGYRVILSTHSPVILDVVWAIGRLRTIEEGRAVHALANIFGLGPLPNKASASKPMRDLLRAALRKEYRTYFFQREAGGVVAQDISALDPGDEDANVSGWGGLSGFSGHIAEVVGQALTPAGA